MSDSGLCCDRSLSMTAESELFLDLNGDLFGLPEDGQDIKPSADIPPVLPLSLQFSESNDKTNVTTT